jgi:hypothetical protein
VVLVGLVGLSAAVVGCSSTAESEPWQLNGGEDGGGSGSGGSGSGGDAGGTSSGGGSGGGSHDAGGSGSGGSHDSGGGGSSGGQTDGGSGSTDSGSGGTMDSGTITSSDGFAASRQACIDKINALRATNTAVKLQPYTLQNDDTTNTCVDTQATTDQSKNSAHWSFINNMPACMWGSPMGWAQNECLQGYGTSPSGIQQCIQDMWDESLKPNCAGCVGCTKFGGACPNCDYMGTMGYECGHYVNLSAPYFTSVACGFAGAAPSSGSGWSVQNFE